MVVNLSWCRFLLVFQEGSNYGSSRIARGPIMEIDNVRREDAGTYMCTASNNVGTMSADEIDLRVLCKFFRDFFTTKDEPSFLKRYFIDHNLLLYAYGSNLTVRTNASFCLDLLGHPSVPSIFQWAFRSQSNESERPKWKMAFFQLWFYMDFAAKGLFFKENDAFQVILHHHVLVSQKYEKNLSFFVILNLHKNTNLNFKITSSSLPFFHCFSWSQEFFQANSDWSDLDNIR